MADLYRKKPVVVEVMGPLAFDNMYDVAGWCSGEADAFTPCVLIYTMEGEMRAGMGDYVIRGVQGEFYPCKPDIFAQTYELVEERDD